MSQSNNNNHNNGVGRSLLSDINSLFNQQANNQINQSSQISHLQHQQQQNINSNLLHQSNANQNNLNQQRLPNFTHFQHPNNLPNLSNGLNQNSMSNLNMNNNAALFPNNYQSMYQQQHQPSVSNINNFHNNAALFNNNNINQNLYNPLVNNNPLSPLNNQQQSLPHFATMNHNNHFNAPFQHPTNLPFQQQVINNQPPPIPFRYPGSIVQLNNPSNSLSQQLQSALPPGLFNNPINFGQPARSQHDSLSLFTDLPVSSLSAPILNLPNSFNKLSVESQASQPLIQNQLTATVPAVQEPILEKETQPVGNGKKPKAPITPLKTPIKAPLKGGLPVTPELLDGGTPVPEERTPAPSRKIKVKGPLKQYSKSKPSKMAALALETWIRQYTGMNNLAENENIYINLSKTLESRLKNVFSDCKIVVYGSSVTGLSIKKSDIDMCLEVPIKLHVPPPPPPVVKKPKEESKDEDIKDSDLLLSDTEKEEESEKVEEVEKPIEIQLTWDEKISQNLITAGDVVTKVAEDLKNGITVIVFIFE